MTGPGEDQSEMPRLALLCDGEVGRSKPPDPHSSLITFALLASSRNRAFDLQIDELRIGLLAKTVMLLSGHAEVAFELAHLALIAFPVREQHGCLAPAGFLHGGVDHYAAAFHLCLQEPKRLRAGDGSGEQRQYE